MDAGSHSNDWRGELGFAVPRCYRDRRGRGERPIIGALLVLALHERRVVPPVSTQLAADEINPLVEQGLQPIADGAIRAAERAIEQEVLDTITEHATHGSSHDPS